MNYNYMLFCMRLYGYNRTTSNLLWSILKPVFISKGTKGNPKMYAFYRSMRERKE